MLLDVSIKRPQRKARLLSAPRSEESALSSSAMSTQTGLSERTTRRCAVILLVKLADSRGTGPSQRSVHKELIHLSQGIVAISDGSCRRPRRSPPPNIRTGKVAPVEPPSGVSSRPSGHELETTVGVDIALGSATIATAFMGVPGPLPFRLASLALFHVKQRPSTCVVLMVDCYNSCLGFGTDWGSNLEVGFAPRDLGRMARLLPFLVMVSVT